MPQQINKKILVYFFLFVIFGSLNNKNLAQLKFPNIEKIEIEGLETENKELQKRAFKRPLVNTPSSGPQRAMIKADEERRKLMYGNKS